MARDRAAHVSLLAVVVVWAGAFGAIKALLDRGVAAEDVAILRYTVAAPGFALLLWRVGGLRGLTRRELGRVLAAGVLVVAVYHLSLNVGTRFTTSGTAALVVALAPALTLAFSLALGLERLAVTRVVGIAVAFAGIVVVVLLGSGASVSFENAKGPLIVLAAPLSFALYNVILKPLLGRHDLLGLTAATSLAGTFALLPLVRVRTVETVVDASVGEALLLLYLGVVCTFLAYIGWNVGLQGLGPSRAVAYAYGIPPLALVLGAVLLDETVTVWLALGGALVVAGVAAAQRASATPAPTKLRPRRYAATSSSISGE